VSEREGERIITKSGESAEDNLFDIHGAYPETLLIQQKDGSPPPTPSHRLLIYASKESSHRANFLRCSSRVNLFADKTFCSFQAKFN